MKNKKNSYFIIIVSVLVIVATVLLLQSFRLNVPPPLSGTSDNKWPGKRELRRNLWQIKKMLLVYGTGNAAVVRDYKAFAERTAKARSYIDFIVKPDSAVTAEERQSMPLTLIGTPASNSVLRELSDSLPIRFKDGSFAIDGVISSQQNDVVSLRNYPNPRNRSLILNITTGNNDDSVVKYLSSENDNRAVAGDFVIYRDEKVILWGMFKQEEGRAWQVDTGETRNYLHNQKQIVETEHYVFHASVGSGERERIEKLAERQEERLARFLEGLNPTAATQFPKIQVFLYASLEDKGLVTGNTDFSHFDPKKWEIHAVCNEDLDGSIFESDARLLAAKLIGRTESLALRDGLGIYFSEGWCKYGYRYWVKKFRDSNNVNPLNDLLDSASYNKQSYLFMRPLAGSLVEFLVEIYGFSEFVDLYKRWPESGLPPANLPGFTLPDLQKNWLAYLQDIDVEEATLDQRASRPKYPVFQKGFCYAHEGYQIHDGYISHKSAESLARLNSLGTEWISLTPYGYLPHGHRPDPITFSSGAGSENDESLISSFLQAKKLGMGVMLKPHILMGGGDWGWAGEVEMKSKAGWRRFFKNYTSWIKHYAMLAEIYDMDAFCIGVELQKTTRRHQQEWREIIREVRQIYHGPLVYAANWGDEFEQIKFWDALDYIGLNCYYPLAKKAEVTLADLKKGAAKFLPTIAQVAAEYNKPVLLTEVGFCSRAGTWQKPHERQRGSVPYFEDQALAYEAVFESFWDQNWFYGFYWWKWPTYLEYGGHDHSGFTPNGKPAEKVVREWYHKTRGVLAPSSSR